MTAKSTKKTAKTLADFRLIHDLNVVVPEKIKKALADMLAEGEEQWEFEQDFLRRAGIANTQISNFRERFSDYIVEARPVGASKASKKIWFASRKVADKAREALM